MVYRNVTKAAWEANNAVIVSCGHAHSKMTHAAAWKLKMGLIQIIYGKKKKTNIVFEGYGEADEAGEGP